MTFAREVLPAERQAASGRHRPPARPAGTSSAVQQLGTIVGNRSLARLIAARRSPAAAEDPRDHHRRPRGAGEAAGSRAPELEAPGRGGAHPGLRAHAAALRQGLRGVVPQVRRGRQARLRRARLRDAGLHARAVPEAGVQDRRARGAQHLAGPPLGAVAVPVRRAHADQGAGARGRRAAAGGAADRGAARGRRPAAAGPAPDRRATDRLLGPLRRAADAARRRRAAQASAPARAHGRLVQALGGSPGVPAQLEREVRGRGHRRSARAHHPRQARARPRRHRRRVGRRDEAGGAGVQARLGQQVPRQRGRRQDRAPGAGQAGVGRAEARTWSSRCTKAPGRTTGATGS